MGAHKVIFETDLIILYNSVRGNLHDGAWEIRATIQAIQKFCQEFSKKSFSLVHRSANCVADCLGKLNPLGNSWICNPDRVLFCSTFDTHCNKFPFDVQKKKCKKKIFEHNKFCFYHF